MKKLILFLLIPLFINGCISTEKTKQPQVIKTIVIQEAIPNGKIFRYDDTGYKQVIVQEKDTEMAMELADDNDAAIVKRIYKVESSKFEEIEKALNAIKSCDMGVGVNIKISYSNSTIGLEYNLPFVTNCYPESTEEIMTQLEELYDWN